MQIIPLKIVKDFYQQKTCDGWVLLIKYNNKVYLIVSDQNDKEFWRMYEMELDWIISYITSFKCRKQDVMGKLTSILSEL